MGPFSWEAFVVVVLMIAFSRLSAACAAEL
jgi:hypothetical protein